MKVAVVDAGSNSFILLIAEKKYGKVNYLLDLSTIVGMGKMKCEEDGIFEKALKTIEKYLKISEEYDVSKRIIVGTEVFRKLPPKYFKKLSEKFDGARILSGKEEAELSYLSVADDEKIPIHSPLVMDIGGGSVEYSFKIEKGLISRSIPMGAIVLTEKYVRSYPVHDQLENAKKFIEKELSFLPQLPLVSIGGTGTTVASVLKGKPFSASLIHGIYISLDEIESLYRRVCSMSLNEISNLPGMEKGREKVIAAGMLILFESSKMSSNRGVYISVRGHRYAMAKKILESGI